MTILIFCFRAFDLIRLIGLDLHRLQQTVQRCVGSSTVSSRGVHTKGLRALHRFEATDGPPERRAFADDDAVDAGPAPAAAASVAATAQGGVSSASASATKLKREFLSGDGERCDVQTSVASTMTPFRCRCSPAISIAVPSNPDFKLFSRLYLLLVSFITPHRQHTDTYTRL